MEAASATQRKEDGVSPGQWGPRGTPGHLGYKDSQDCRAGKEIKANGDLLDQQDQKETWDREASPDSRVLMEFLDTQGKVAPEEGLATTAAMGPGEMKARRGLLALGASLASPGPKDPRGRKANLMHCLEKTATSTGVNLESLDWLAFRGLLAAQGR